MSLAYACSPGPLIAPGAILWWGGADFRTHFEEAFTVTRSARSSTTPGRLILIIVAATVFAGCATTFSRGVTAYRQGRFDEAVARFQAVLAEAPDRLDALVGLGLAYYKLGAWDNAIEALSRAAAIAPNHGPVRLGLGLTHLQRGDDAQAQEHLAASRALWPDPRTQWLIDRALALLRSGPPTAELRKFVAASLEASVESQRELGEMRRALEEEEYRRFAFYDDVVYVVPRCR
jgi:tetratricopeptide (TPR) repeat protein